MSKIITTINYLLHKYGGIKYPLFLNDFNDNMDIIDEVMKGIDDRLVDVERVIDTVSTQNIDDLMARLAALEIKVDNNASAINNLLTQQTVLSNRITANANAISTINATLIDVESDISELQSCCETVNNTLANHETRISTNTTAIDNINSEIDRIKQNVAGNSQDIITLGTQIQTLDSTKQNVLTAGSGISIVNDVISATGSGGGVIGSYDSDTENVNLI